MRTNATKATVLVSLGVMAMLLAVLWPADATTFFVRSVHAAEPEQSNRQPVTPTRPPQAVKLQPEIREAVRGMANTSSQGLVERAHPDGGYTVDLQGRFRSVPVAIIGDDGQVSIHEFSAPPPAE